MWLSSLWTSVIGSSQTKVRGHGLRHRDLISRNHHWYGGSNPKKPGRTGRRFSTFSHFLTCSTQLHGFEAQNCCLDLSGRHSARSDPGPSLKDSFDRLQIIRIVLVLAFSSGKSCMMTHGTRNRWHWHLEVWKWRYRARLTRCATSTGNESKTHSPLQIHHSYGISPCLLYSYIKIIYKWNYD